MFGNAPCMLWPRWMQSDTGNRTDPGCRTLLVRDGKCNVPVKTGIGAFFPPALCQHYSVQEERHILLDNPAAVGLDDTGISVVLLTHLHFDYAGGLFAAREEGQPTRLLFPNVYFVSGRCHWQRTRQSHPRSRTSSVLELFDLLRASRRLESLDDSERSTRLGED